MDYQVMRELANSYQDVSIGVLGSHSALDVCEGAKRLGIKTIVACKKGREKTYKKYFATRYLQGKEVGCVDEVLVLDEFQDLLEKQNLEFLKVRNTIFVQHRSFAVYVGYESIENRFVVPVFGNRFLLRAEERTAPNNQLDLLKKARIRTPQSFASPDDIDRLVLVKASDAKRSYERAFFFANSGKEYENKSKEMVSRGFVSEAGLKSALIEEFVVGAQYNFNFFYSPLNKELELIGTDTRRQTNLDGLLRLPAAEQLEITKSTRIVSNIEVGHIACTLRESLLENVFDAGERFIETCRKEYPPGIIGPFALQGAVVPEESGEELVIFDVSFRMPGSPGVRFTPYSDYLYGESLSMGRRTAMEVKAAFDEGRLSEVVT